MNERSLSVSPAIEPFAGGVIGLGIGYTVAPRKYSLQRLLILKEDRFEKIYSKELADNMSTREKLALESIKNARTHYRESKKLVINQVRTAAKGWQQKFTKVDVSEELNTAYQESKANLQKAIQDNNYIELNQKYRKAKEALKLSPDSEELKAALNEANSNLAAAKAILSSKIDIYKTCVKNIRNERLSKVKNNPGLYANVREAYHEFLTALARRRTVSSNKLFELTNSKNLQKSYEILKEYLPKARTKSAVTGALSLATLSAIVVSSITPRQHRKSA